MDRRDSGEHARELLAAFDVAAPLSRQSAIALVYRLSGWHGWARVMEEKVPDCWWAL